jgi:hypothetical protein
MVCHLRPLTYSLGLNITPHIARQKYLTLQTGSLSMKNGGAGFQSIAKLRSQIINPELADRGVYSADCHNENGSIADCQSQESEFESGMPKA